MSYIVLFCSCLFVCLVFFFLFFFCCFFFFVVVVVVFSVLLPLRLPRLGKEN